MNLRENKIDKFSAPKKKNFFGFLKKGQDAKKIAPAKKIAQITAPEQPQLLKSAHVDRLDLPQKEQWVRKESERSVVKELLDFQENHQHIEEHSPYIKESPDDVLVHWRGPEFEHYPRDRQWYVGAALILCAIIVYAIFTDSIIMAIVFILVGLTGYLLLSRPQKVIDFAITYDGVLVGNEMYKYDEIRSFWIFYEPPHTRVISLHMKGHFRPYLHVPLHQIDPVIVLENLRKFIPEIKQEQGFIDIFERLLRM